MTPRTSREHLERIIAAHDATMETQASEDRGSEDGYVAAVEAARRYLAEPAEADELVAEALAAVEQHYQPRFNDIVRRLASALQDEHEAARWFFGSRDGNGPRTFDAAKKNVEAATRKTASKGLHEALKWLSIMLVDEDMGTRSEVRKILLKNGWRQRNEDDDQLYPPS